MEAYADWLPMLAALLGAGVAGGLLAGLLGVGGGIVIVPALDFALVAAGVPAAVALHMAVATSMALARMAASSSASAFTRACMPSRAARVDGRDRLRSYLGAWGASPRIDALLTEAEALEYVVTDSAVDALVLENNLIKQRLPRYNIRLRDDKNYPFLKLTISEAFPRVMVARRAERDGNLYAGPFLPASVARRSISLAHRLFGLRSCNEEITGKRDRPCLEYDIGRCVAPCVDTLCSSEQYRAAVDRTRLLLEGRNTDAHRAARTRDMREAVGAERLLPRLIAMYLSKQLTNLSLSDIGKNFGGKDHATVIYACKQVEEKRAKEETFNSMIESLIRKIKG